MSGAVSRLIVCANAGLTGTALRRKMMDADAMRLGLENTTTARDQATLLDAIAWRNLLPGPLRAFALQALERQQLNEGLPALLPDDVIVAHKTGTLPGVQHDVGIITGANGREAVVAALLSGLEARPLNLPSDGSALPACPPAPSVALAAVGFAAWRALGGSVSSTRYTRCHSQPEDGMILPAATTLHGKHDEH